jgi:hypothetical protein
MPMFSAIAEPKHSFGQVLAAPQQTIGRKRKSSTPRPRFSFVAHAGVSPRLLLMTPAGGKRKPANGDHLWPRRS